MLITGGIQSRVVYDILAIHEYWPKQVVAGHTCNAAASVSE